MDRRPGGNSGTEHWPVIMVAARRRSAPHPIAVSADVWLSITSSSAAAVVQTSSQTYGRFARPVTTAGTA